MQDNMEIIFRKAKKADIPNVVKMLDDDELGSKREDYKVLQHKYLKMSIKVIILT